MLKKKMSIQKNRHSIMLAAMLCMMVIVSMCLMVVHSQKNQQTSDNTTPAQQPIQQPLIDLIQKLSLDQRKNLVHILMDSMTQTDEKFGNDWNCPDTCRGYNGKCFSGCTLATLKNYDCDNTC